MITLLNRLLFWSGAKNRHGIHSPFIYDFLDRTLYGSKDRGAPPEERLLRAAIRHFKPGRAGCETASRWTQLLRTTGIMGADQEPPYDLFVFDRPGPEVIDWIEERDNWHNETVLYIGGLAQGGRMDRSWRNCLESESVRICLEAYPAALLFFRKEQAPQHFRIRI